jgi:hypothetical protein
MTLRDLRAVARDVRAIVALHLAFFAGTGVTAALSPPAKGWWVLALVVAYNVGVPLVARAVGRDDWVALWAFLLPVSIFQILPDWVLADLIGTLRFPVIGGPRIDDAINLAMGGMWVAPLFIVLVLARGRAGVAAALAFGVFVGSELLAPVLELWEPVGETTEVAGVAIYVLPAEAALGWATAMAYGRVGRAGVAKRVAAALAISTFYLGALVLAHFVIDIAGWSISTA